jgi:CubicO group peptidase (beta-lactamase class C family)
MDIRIHTAQSDIPPAEAGYRQQTIERLDALLLGLIRDRKLQCASYLLAKDGSTFAVKSMGRLRNVEDSGDLLPDSIRRVASITKWLTLVAILRLMEEGKLYLQQPVKSWIKEFEHSKYEKITIYHLLTHTSGLPADPLFYTEPYPIGWWDIQFAFEERPDELKPERSPEEELAFRKSQWIKAMLAVPPAIEPGKEWIYSSAGYSVLGEIISRIAGKTYYEYVRETILEPLGMSRSFFDVPEELQAETCVLNDWEAARLTERANRSALPPRAGGGLYSTLHDLNRFGEMMLTGAYKGNRIISRKSVELITRDQFPQGLPAFNWGADEKAHHFGIGCFLPVASDFHGPSAYLHEGAGRSLLMVDPAENFVAVLFIPSIVDWVPESIIHVKNVIWSGFR